MNTLFPHSHRKIHRYTNANTSNTRSHLFTERELQNYNFLRTLQNDLRTNDQLDDMKANIRIDDSKTNDQLDDMKANIRVGDRKANDQMYDVDLSKQNVQKQEEHIQDETSTQEGKALPYPCLLYTSPSPRDA